MNETRRKAGKPGKPQGVVERTEGTLHRNGTDKASVTTPPPTIAASCFLVIKASR